MKWQTVPNRDTEGGARQIILYFMDGQDLCQNVAQTRPRFSSGTRRNRLRCLPACLTLAKHTSGDGKKGWNVMNQCQQRARVLAFAVLTLPFFHHFLPTSASGICVFHPHRLGLVVAPLCEVFRHTSGRIFHANTHTHTHGVLYYFG